MIKYIRTALNVDRHRLATGFLALLILFFFITFVHHRNRERGIATSKATGLSGLDTMWHQPMAATNNFQLWHTAEPEPLQVDFAYAGSGPNSGSRLTYKSGATEQLSADTHPERTERQVVRIGTFEIIASDPLQTAERLRILTGELSGFVVNFSASGSDRQSRTAQLSVRVPAISFDEARSQVRRIAATVAREAIEARDVTRDYLDQAAALRNARAEETQYLAILKHASAVKDILEVSSRLSEVRGRIDVAEVDLRLLRSQVDMSLLTINISAREEEKMLGIHWRPGHQAKESMRGALVEMADYANEMVALFQELPLIVIWGFTIIALVKAGWIIFRWTALLFFPGFTWLRRAPKTQAA